MTMTITTPSLLFPAISLLLLAYTNRFLVITKVIRELAQLAVETDEDLLTRQIQSLKTRIQLIRAMQMLAVLSFVVCTLSMLALFVGVTVYGEILFGLALALLTFSLLVSLFEVHMSTKAISFEIERLSR